MNCPDVGRYDSDRYLNPVKVSNIGQMMRYKEEDEERFETWYEMSK